MRLTIRRKLLANFAIVCTLAVLNAAVVYFKVADLRSRQSNLARVSIPAIQDINDIRIADQRMVNGLYGYVFIKSDTAFTDANKKQIAQSRQRVEDDLARLREKSGNFNNPENDARIGEIGGRLVQLTKAADSIQRQGPGDKAPSHRAMHLLTSEVIPSANKIRDLSKDLIASVNDITEKDNVELAASSRIIAWMLLGCTATLILLAGISSWLIASGIVAPLSEVVARAESIADGDLTGSSLETEGEDEIAILTAAVNRMQSNLSEMLQSVAATAGNVASASEEISANANVSAAGAEAQKDQVHQVAEAMQQITAKVKEVSDNSKNAEELASQASQIAHDGGAIVSDTLDRIRTLAGFVRDTDKRVQDLGSRSNQIGKIIVVIEHIADQTNLLALNAAIEAARAGEQGRGFAVVADEVRKLAERTTSATKEIAEVIQAVQKETQLAVSKMQSGIIEVEKGVEATGRAGDSLKQIIHQADNVGEVVTQIATAATEQSFATTQINSTMEQINHLVAESAEGARQSAQACEQLSASALELQQLVDRFKLVSHRPIRRTQSDGPPIVPEPLLAMSVAAGSLDAD